MDLLTEAAQFGIAGLIAAMWLVERRTAHQRETELTQAHHRILEQRTQLDALITVVTDNTRAVTALESTHRHLTQLIERLSSAPSQG